MSKITRLQVKSFLLEKKGYIKKSPLKIAERMWKAKGRTSLPKTHKELTAEIDLIRSVLTTIRTSINHIASKEEESVLDIYNKIEEYNNRPKKVLFFDIEVSPNLVLSWGIGNKISIPHHNIVQERAIMCICYKWAGSDKVFSLEWNKGDDKEMLKKFAKIIDSADEVIGQNSDQFDIKWVRTRCILHNIPMSVKLNSIDTLKMARAGFRFNCNRLDYMGKFFGMGGKTETNYDMWKDILLKNCKKSMDDMVQYCKDDVLLLEKIYNKLQAFVPIKKFKYKL